MFNTFPFKIQLDKLDCGPTCLYIICKHYGLKYSVNFLRDLCDKQKTGTSLYQISEAAKFIGFHCEGLKMNFDNLSIISLPLIAHINQNHFVVVYKLNKNYIYVSDPAKGKIKMSKAAFLKSWSFDGFGKVLTIEKNEQFKSFLKLDTDSEVDIIGKIIKVEFNKYKKYFLLILIFFCLTATLQFLMPKLTQSLYDEGIANKNFWALKLIGVSFLIITLTKALLDAFKSFFFLKISNKVNLNLISSFYKKIFQLPISFLDRKNVGDILQRISDHNKIESFLTYNIINIFINIISIVVFTFVLIFIKPLFVILFIVFFSLNGVITYYFIKRRNQLDAERYEKTVENQDEELEIIYGLQEIKLQSAEHYKIENWRKKQQAIIKINERIFKINQQQSFVSNLIPELLNLALTICCAYYVIYGTISIGQMFSISFIIGQLNSPLNALLQSYNQYNEVLLSKNRINDFYNVPDELITPEEQHDFIINDINLINISFKYQKGEKYPFQLKNINCGILKNKITAIVGSSGSGKTTFIKLLLRFYKPVNGEILINDVNADNYDLKTWRFKFGVVMQDGYIFSDTILNNIIFGNDNLDAKKLENVLKAANLEQFIETLPYGLETKIGQNGTGLSAGQKQRLLIARALYKEVEVLIFDEATNALDSINEKEIVSNIQKYFTNKTIIIIAHRLSTIKNADNIIVLNNGILLEQGNHNELIERKGYYSKLINAQL